MGIVALGGAFGSKGSLTGVAGAGISGAFGSKGSVAGALGLTDFSGAFGSRGSATGGFVNDASVDDGVERLAGLPFNLAAACAVLANNSAKVANNNNMVC
jgi:hypothetical protein